MIPFIQVPDTADADIVPVDCPTCPVNLSCLTGTSGTGWRFTCCGTAVLDLGLYTVMVDCQINAFRDEHDRSIFDPCPLCSGAIMEVVALAEPNTSKGMRYLPTVHAKFPLVKRLTVLRHRDQEVKRRRTLVPCIKNEEG